MVGLTRGQRAIITGGGEQDLVPGERPRSSRSGGASSPAVRPGTSGAGSRRQCLLRTRCCSTIPVAPTALPRPGRRCPCPPTSSSPTAPSDDGGHRPVAEAVAVVGDTIVAVGDRADVAREVGPGTRTVDLGGRALIPGINDNHTHPIAFGQSLRTIDARPATVASLAGLQDAFRAAAQPLERVGRVGARARLRRHPPRHRPPPDPTGAGRGDRGPARAPHPDLRPPRRRQLGGAGAGRRLGGDRRPRRRPDRPRPARASRPGSSGKRRSSWSGG
jgi:hypothetical protein